MFLLIGPVGAVRARKGPFPRVKTQVPGEAGGSIELLAADMTNVFVVLHAQSNPRRLRVGR